MKLHVPHPLLILAAAMVLAVVAAGLGLAVPAYQQHRAIATIERLGGHVNTKSRGPDCLRDLVDDEQLKRFDEVTSFSVCGPEIQGVDWDAVSVLAAVKRIGVYGAQLKDVKALSRLPNL